MYTLAVNRLYSPFDRHTRHVSLPLHFHPSNKFSYAEIQVRSTCLLCTCFTDFFQLPLLPYGNILWAGFIATPFLVWSHPPSPPPPFRALSGGKARIYMGRFQLLFVLHILGFHLFILLIRFSCFKSVVPQVLSPDSNRALVFQLPGQCFPKARSVFALPNNLCPNWT